MLVVGATIVALLAVLYGSAHHIVMGGFLRLEEHAVHRNAQRARDALLDRMQVLRVKTADWAVWDDSYNFLRTRDPAFVETNLQSETLTSLEINYIAFYDVAGQLVHAKYVVEGEERPVPASFLKAFGPSEKLLGQRGATNVVSGIVVLPGGPLLFAARPVVNSLGEGPVRGVVLFARRLDDELIQAVSAVTHLPLEILPWSDAGLPTAWRQSPLASLEDTATLSHVIDGRNVAGYFQVRDVRGRPTLFGRVSETRSIVAMGEASLRYLLVSLVLLGGGYAFTTRLLLNRLVLSRVAALRDGVRRIGRRPDLAAGLALSGHDELSDLAADINCMVATLSRTQNQLRTAGQLAEEANRTKSEFLANMSHEIRTPMTAILGFTDLLRDPGLSAAERGNHVDVIRRNGEHLLAIINDILDLSKIEAGRMSVERIGTPLVQIVEEVVSLLRVRATEKKLRLETQWSFPLPRTIQSDPVRLRQVLMNLIGNAVKFTERGGVTVRTELDLSAEWPRIAIEVTDTGIGMAANEVAHLFQAFSQADGSTTRHFGGTGLGLVISRRLAEMLGGSIEVSSAPRAGSTFRLLIDPGSLEGAAMIRGESGLAQPSEAPAAPHNVDLSGRRVLLAEDGPDNQRLIGFVLRKAGAEVELADHGEEARELALRCWREGRPFDVVLMDMQMPRMDGYTATRLLRDEGYPGPILALTAHAMSGDRDKCLAAGCDDYATKPIDRVRLLSLIAEWSSGEGPRRDAADDPLSPSESLR